MVHRITEDASMMARDAALVAGLPGRLTHTEGDDDPNEVMVKQ
jgi:hypothetical protein